jgi:hypothetical protein
MSKLKVKFQENISPPKYLYHLVPSELFYKFVDDYGNYDCRNKKEWGNNSPFIHTTPTKKQLKERVADPNWSKYPREKKFLLLKINSRVDKLEFTNFLTRGYIYYHIWDQLSKNTFNILKVKRSRDGKFLI